MSSADTLGTAALGSTSEVGTDEVVGMMIGDVELPIVSSIEPSSDAESDEIRGNQTSNIVVKHEREPMTLTIEGFLSPHAHSLNNPLSTQKSDLKSLGRKDLSENPVNYGDWKGHLVVENIDFTENSDSGIIDEVVIDAKFHPWPKFLPENEP